MNYERPTIAIFANAVEAVKEGGPGKVLDPDLPSVAGAYEVDESS